MNIPTHTNKHTLISKKKKSLGSALRYLKTKNVFAAKSYKCPVLSRFKKHVARRWKKGTFFFSFSVFSVTFGSTQANPEHNSVGCHQLSLGLRAGLSVFPHPPWAIYQTYHNSQGAFRTLVRTSRWSGTNKPVVVRACLAGYCDNNMRRLHRMKTLLWISNYHPLGKGDIKSVHVGAKEDAWSPYNCDVTQSNFNRKADNKRHSW